MYAFLYSRPMIASLIAGLIALASLPAAAFAAETKADSGASSESVLLRYGFKAGQFVHYEVASTSRLILQARQEVQTISEKRSTRKHYRVVSVAEDGTAVLEPVIDHVLMEARSDDQEPIVFDSDSSEPVPTQFTRISRTVGKAVVRVRYSACGEVDEVLPVAVNRETTTGDEETHQFLITFPEDTIALGESWDDDFTVKVAIAGEFKKPIHKPVTIRRRYTLKSVDGDIARISFATYPLSTDSDPQIQMQLVQRSLTGDVEFDLKNGVIRKWTSSGSGQVFNPFGPGSSAQATSSNVEQLVTSARPRKQGPIGPQLPGLPAAAGAGD
jgi:hypothetical protein